MQAIKGYSAKQIIKHLKYKNPQKKINHVFLSESFDRIIRNEIELTEKMIYIMNNPVKKGLTDDGYNYKWYYIGKY